MKKMLTLALIGAVALGAVTFTSCDNGGGDGDDPKPEYTVTFNAEGGTPAPAAQKVKEGETAAAPPAVSKTGYVFLFWSLNGTSAYNFSAPVTGNITLTAKWTTEDGNDPAATSFTIRNTAEWNAAVSAIKAGGNKSYALTIEGNVSVPPTTGVEQGKPETYTFGGGEGLIVTLKGNGTLALSAPGFLICVSGKSGDRPELIIDGPTLQGRADNVASLLRFDHANIELKAGKITGNVSDSSGSGSGGGVAVVNGYFTMSGGEITNNSCGADGYAGNGGGVYLSGVSFLAMSGGTISGNSAEDGGGVYVGNGMTMTGGTIKGNTAFHSYGGGVYVHSSGHFTKTGGVIFGSDAVEADQNKTFEFKTEVVTNHGAAVYHPVSSIIGPSKDYHWEKTLGEDDDIDTDFAPEPEEPKAHTYTVVKELKNWADAAADAVSRGGYLVEIGSQEEQDAVYKAIRDAGVSTTYTSVGDGGGIAYVWIGAKATVVFRAWMWNGAGATTGTFPVFWNGNANGSAVNGSYVNWGGKSKGRFNEPDNFTDSSLAPNGQDAAAIGLASWPRGASSPLGVAGEWNDIASTNKIYYVVEIGE
jgi:uncharacterized repeat protein (TIGR02543 family)